MDVMLIIFSMVITLIAAALTVPAGFGLATMLTPVVLLWLPPHEAIAVVAIIHGAHNAWKLKVLRSSINIDAETTANVVDLPTPCAPPVELYP